MTHQPSSAMPEQVVQQAAAWVARIQSGDASAQDRRAFQLWMQADAGHRQAYEELSQLWGDLSEVSLPEGRLQYLRRRRALPRRVAMVLALCGLGFVFSQLPYLDRWRADQFTRIGEVRRIALADGSAMTLNTNSAVKLHFTEGQRRVEILRGEVFFDVESDPQRPFVVAYGDLTARVLGTRFSLGELQAGAQPGAVVEEGRVGVETMRSSLELGAGQWVAVDDTGQPHAHEGGTDALLAWRSGALVFSDTPLANVLATLERYQTGRIVTLDDALADLRVSGVFDLNDPDAALAALETSLSIRVHQLGPALTVVRK